MKNGRTYVPIADAAKVFGVQVRKTESGFEFFQEGGANQLSGLTGKVGQVLSCGWATVKVTKVERAGKHYVKQFTDGDLDAINDADEIVAVTMRVKNATKEPQMFQPVGDQHISLIDDDEHSFPPITGLGIDQHDRATNMLPGSAYDFAVLFNVPKKAKLTQFVYGVDFMNPKLPHKDFRIDIAPAPTP